MIPPESEIQNLEAVVVKDVHELLFESTDMVEEPQKCSYGG